MRGKRQKKIMLKYFRSNWPIWVGSNEYSGVSKQIKFKALN